MPLLPSFNVDISQTKLGLFIQRTCPTLFNLLTASRDSKRNENNAIIAANSPKNDGDDAEAIAEAELAARFTDQE